MYAEEQAARWTLRLLAGAVFLVVVAGTLVLSLKSLDGTAPSAAAPAGGVQSAGPALVSAVGPLPGVDLAAYVDNRRRALAMAKTDRVAVASLAAYATETQAKALAGAAGINLVGLLAAAPGTAPSIVTGDMATWARAQTEASRQEADEIRKLLPTVDDPSFKSFYQSELARLDKAVKSVNPDSPLIFALVVRGPAAALQQLATRSEVRLVDIGDGADPAPKADYRGVRPEEQKQANVPPVRPA